MVTAFSPVLHSFAYIEFSDRSSVQSAIGLHETLFRGRVLKVKATVALNGSILNTFFCLEDNYFLCHKTNQLNEMHIVFTL